MLKHGLRFFTFLNLFFNAGLVTGSIKSNSIHSPRFLTKLQTPAAQLCRLKGSGDLFQQGINTPLGLNSQGSFLGSSLKEQFSQAEDKDIDLILQLRIQELLYANSNSEGIGVDYLGNTVYVDDSDSDVLQNPSMDDPESQELDVLASRTFRAMERFQLITCISA